MHEQHLKETWQRCAERFRPLSKKFLAFYIVHGSTPADNFVIWRVIRTSKGDPYRH